MNPVTVEDVQAWLDVEELPAAVTDRLVARASAHVAGIMGQAPLTEVEQAAFSDAVCAQVEQWLSVGEDTAIDGTHGPMNVGGVNLPGVPRYAPRALAALRAAGLLRVWS